MDRAFLIDKVFLLLFVHKKKTLPAPPLIILIGIAVEILRVLRVAGMASNL